MINKILLAAVFLLVSLGVSAEIIQQEISYKQGDTQMKGFLAYDDAISGKRPGILVVHEWWGHNDYARKRALMLAKSGYTALAVDMYGDGKTANHPEDASKFSNAVGGDLPLAKARFLSAISTLQNQSTVEADDIAAIGYCFGGGIVLKMARLGVDIDGVVSFHGSVATNSAAVKGDIKAKVRVFNGADDPFVKAEQISAFKQEMKNADVDYQFVNYAGAKHSFTNPGSTAIGEKFGLPLEYNETADKDSWAKTIQFFTELFPK